MDDFIAAGYKGYQSIQETAGMDTRRVKDKYGDKLTLWTGIQCETLVSGTMDDVEKEVRGAERSDTRRRLHFRLNQFSAIWSKNR